MIHPDLEQENHTIPIPESPHGSFGPVKDARKHAISHADGECPTDTWIGS